MTMLYMAERSEKLELTPVLYQNSGDSEIGDRNRVVGYWAIAGSEKPTKDLAFNLTEQDRESLLQISRATLETFLTSGTLSEISPAALSPALKVPAGAFVSLYMGGRLRGCIGSFSPEDPLYAVVESMTLAAALKDARFAPVEETELAYIEIEISVLTPLKRINSVDEFELGRHGIYMIKNDQSGTFLPQVAEDTGWSKEEFLGHCARDKAGIGWDGWKEAELYIYEAIVFKENGMP